MAIKLGLMTTGPFSEHAGQPVDLDGYLGLVRGWGLENLDIFAEFFRAAPPATVREALDRHGLTCACYYIATDLNATGPEAEAKADEAFRQGLENAHILGAPLAFTYGTQHTYAGADMLQRYIDRLGAMLPLFAGTGITFVIENAGTLLHKVADMLQVIDQLGDAGLRLCLDTGNFYLWEQDEVAATRRALSWTVHFHFKDYIDQRWLGEGQPTARQMALGAGVVRNAEVLAILQQEGFAGTLALEPASVQTIEPDIKTLRAWLDE